MDDLGRAVTELVRRRVAESDGAPETGGLALKSLELVALIVELEEAFSVRFPADLLTPETFRDEQAVVDAVRGLREVPG